MRLGAAEVRFTTVTDGDFSDAASPREREASQRAVADLAWRTVRQVHGSAVAVVGRDTDSSGVEADALVTSAPNLALAVRTADCAPIALAGGDVIGVAHGGWRGLMAGVVHETVAAMRAAGADRIVAALGPCIHAECYEFTGDELDAVTARFGSAVRGSTSAGAPALDLPAVVRAVLAEDGIELRHDAGICTACSESHWSHRARGDTQRQATVIWRP